MSECPVCGGIGWIISINEFGQKEAVFCKCRENILLKQRISFADIPPVYKETRLNNFTLSAYQNPSEKRIATAACKKIKTYLDYFSEYKKSGLGLYLYSETKGSGKTRMAASLANKFLDDGYVVKFATSSRILNAIKKTYDKDSKQKENELLEDLATTDILFIDDFGSENLTGWVNDKFYHIINERYINKKLTFFTSNVAVEHLDYDDRIKSRVQDMTYQIPFPEESVRQTQARERNKKLLSEIL